jgi:hypothetical protein
MRAISPIAAYGITVQSPRVRRGPDASGTVQEYFEGDLIHAQFERGGLTEWEQLVALESFDFSGLPDGVNPLTRVSVFDSEMYVQRFPKDERDKLQAKIDERLRELQQTFPSEFMIVEKPPAATPWPTYDLTPIEDAIDRETGDVVVPGIFTMQRLSGISPETVRLYEIEHQNRPEVIEQMEALEAEIVAETAEGAISVAL